jgi:hypothetical protein
MALSTLFGPLFAGLLLNPVLAEDGQLRIVAVGADVEWHLDGAPIAETQDGQPALVEVAAGEHELWAVSDDHGSWQAMVRVEPEPAAGVAYVPAWSARHAVEREDGGLPGWTIPAALAVVGALLLLPRRRGREGDAATQSDEHALLEEPAPVGEPVTGPRRGPPEPSASAQTRGPWAAAGDESPIVPSVGNG